MILFLLIGKVLAFLVFCILTAFVLVFGKDKTFIKLDYMIVAVLLIVVLVVL